MHSMTEHEYIILNIIYYHAITLASKPISACVNECIYGYNISS